MAITIPYQQTDSRQVNQFQQALKQALQPLTSQPQSEGIILTQVALVAGTNTIPTMINRKLQGWSLVRVRAASTVYDTQDSNPNPFQTLVLVASAPVVVDIFVF